MTPEHAKAMLPFIQAFAEGKTIEVVSMGVWAALRAPDFLSDPRSYRIKPDAPALPEPPHGTANAAEWAYVFVEHVRAQPGLPTDIDAMVGWFANAMESRAAHGAKRGANGISSIPCTVTRADVDHVMAYVRRRHHEALCGSEDGGVFIAERDSIWGNLSPELVSQLLAVFMRFKHDNSTP